MTAAARSNTDYLGHILDRHEREFFAFKKMNPVEQAKYQAHQYLHYSTNAWSFQRDCVFTLNQVSQEMKATQPYPGYLEYLRFLTQLWLMEQLIAVPKSRRMFCSWNFISLYTHDTIFKEGRFNGFVSKKEEDADDLVSRGEFIYEHIPDWRIPRELLPKAKRTSGVLEFPDTNSKIQGFPMGADQLRQFTMSGLFGDECAFWPQAQKFYSASKPTLDGGGRMTLVSSRSPGFFKKICYDRLDAKDLNFRTQPPVQAQRPMEGIEIWRNPKNKFVVVDLSYTADPRKRGIEWREAVKASMPSQAFAMEYEKNWETFEEDPVLPDFNKDIHVRIGKIPIEAQLPLLITFSFGRTPSCMISQQVGRQLKLLKEFQVKGSVTKLGHLVWSYLSLEYSSWIARDNYHCWADPKGFEIKKNDSFSSVDRLNKIGFKNINAGEQVWETRKTATEDRLTKTFGEGPAFEISDECVITVAALAGGYRFKDSEGDEEQAQITPIRDKYMRSAECVNYVCAAVAMQAAIVKDDPPVPRYAFQK